MARRKKSPKYKMYGTFKVPKKQPYQYKSIKNYLNQVYRLNKDKVEKVINEATGQPLSKEQFVNELRSRIGVEVEGKVMTPKRAIETLSRTRDYLSSEELGYMNVRKTVRGNREFNEDLEKVNDFLKSKKMSPLRQKDFSTANFTYDRESGTFVYKKESSIRFQYVIDKDHPYRKGKSLIRVFYVR